MDIRTGQVVRTAKYARVIGIMGRRGVMSPGAHPAKLWPVDQS
jgi:hypothetical protein